MWGVEKAGGRQGQNLCCLLEPQKQISTNRAVFLSGTPQASWRLNKRVRTVGLQIKIKQQTVDNTFQHGQKINQTMSL